MDKIRQVNGCHVMAKPSSSKCNIDCDYCFYLEKEMLYPDQKQQWKMNDETLEKFIKQYIEAQNGNHVEFAWQGGEPTLMGIDFFERAMVLQAKYKGDKTIANSFQTNGIALNQSWCDFLKRHHFLVGVSIDGPQKHHDQYRKTRSGKGTHTQVIAAITLLKKNNITFNTLTVVNRHNAKYPLEIYRYLKKIGSTYIQFIPLVERKSSQPTDDGLYLVSPEHDSAHITEWSVVSQDYGNFLTTVYDEWINNDVGKVYIQMFESALSSWCGDSSTLCIFAESCGHSLALESNGDVYNCDHFVYPEYKLGNIHHQSLTTMNYSEQARRFGQDKSDTLNTKCRRCEYLSVCHGGCPKHRISNVQGYSHHNYLCAAYYQFFQHATPTMNVMSRLIEDGRPIELIMPMLSTRAKTINKRSRNVQCPCGSGKKFKRCCGQ